MILDPVAVVIDAVVALRGQRILGVVGDRRRRCRRRHCPGSLKKRRPLRPMRAMRAMVDAALEDVRPLFTELYANTGRPSIPPSSA